MAAPTLKDLEMLEAKHHLRPDGLNYQQRCSRIAKVMKGESWEPSKKSETKGGTIERTRILSPTEAFEKHGLANVRLLITPLMVGDKNRNVYFEEPVGHDIQVEEMQAGAMLHGEPRDVDRAVGDYKIISQNPNKTVFAKTTLPKIGQEISWLPSKELVPVVRGNDGQKGYIWAMPTHMRQYGDTMIQIYGLKTLITQIAPELLPRFSGRPVMSFIDGLTLVASIPLTEAILKEHQQKERRNAALGLD